MKLSLFGSKKIDRSIEFDVNNIDRIYIQMHRDIITNVPKYSASIKFEKDNLSLTKTIEKCKDLTDAFLQTKNFIDNL